MLYTSEPRSTLPPLRHAQHLQTAGMALTFDNRCCAAAATRNSASCSSNESESNLDDFLALRIVLGTDVVHPPEPPLVHVAIAAHGIAAREYS
jgi:hypothetical protein